MDTRTEPCTVASISRPDKDGKCTFSVMMPPLKLPLNFYHVPYADVSAFADGAAFTLLLKKGREKDLTKTDERARYFWDYVGVQVGTPAVAPAVAQDGRSGAAAANHAPAASGQSGHESAQGNGNSDVPRQLTFTISYGRTVNLGNFNSERIEFSAEFDRGGELTPQIAFQRVKAHVTAMMNATEKSRSAKAGEPPPNEADAPEDDGMGV